MIYKSQKISNVELTEKISQLKKEIDDYYENSVLYFEEMLENQREELESSISQVKSIETEILELDSKRKELLLRAGEITNAIPITESNSKKVTSLYEEKQKVYNKYLAQLEQNTKKEFYQLIYQLNGENSYNICIYSNTKTIPIMDEFYNSDKMFLVLKNIFILENKSIYDNKYISLVITRGYSNIEHTKIAPTMTELKQNSYRRLSYSLFPERMKPLVNVIKEICAENELNSGDKIPFKIPMSLGGQTHINQTGFGSIYEWGELVYEGTLYGEVTDFFIIGFIIE